MLWFPEWFTRLLPGRVIIVATIVHSDEALPAVGFIFIIHFFNTHFRPEKFPMDMAMFTGRTPVEELKIERPRLYEGLVRTNELEKHLVPQAPKEFRFWSAVFGTLALVVGFTLVLFIIWSMIFGYRRGRRVQEVYTQDAHRESRLKTIRRATAAANILRASIPAWVSRGTSVNAAGEPDRDPRSRSPTRL